MREFQCDDLNEIIYLTNILLLNSSLRLFHDFSPIYAQEYTYPTDRMNYD